MLERFKDKRKGERTGRKSIQHITVENTNSHSSGLTESDQRDGLQANITAIGAQGAGGAATVHCAFASSFSVDPQGHSVRGTITTSNV